eukprot:jgi/Ulvmu1/12621/UM093_0013.1
MVLADIIADPELAQHVLKTMPVGRRVYQPSTGRHGFIANQQDHYMAPDTHYAEPWHQCFHQHINWKVTLQGDEKIHEDMLPKGFPLDKVLKQAHLHWAPTMYRGASLYHKNDAQLPEHLQKHPQKIKTAAQISAQDAQWAELLQTDYPYTMFLADDTTFSHPLFLGNTFWPGAPNLECMFDYDVRSVPGEKLLRQWARVLQRFLVSDYDMANGDKVSDTLFKAMDQRCMLEDRGFDAAVAEMTNDDIPATHLRLDPEIEELVELAMQAREAEIEAGVFDARVEEARAAREGRGGGGDAPGPAPEQGVGTGAGPGRGAGKRGGVRQAPPVIDELKFLQLLLDEGVARPKTLEATRKSGIVKDFQNSAYINPPRPRAERSKKRMVRAWGRDSGKVFAPLSAPFRKRVLKFGWKVAVSGKARARAPAERDAAAAQEARKKGPKGGARARTKKGAHVAQTRTAAAKNPPKPSAKTKPTKGSASGRAASREAAATARARAGSEASAPAPSARKRSHSRGRKGGAAAQPRGSAPAGAQNASAAAAAERAAAAPAKHAAQTGAGGATSNSGAGKARVAAHRAKDRARGLSAARSASARPGPELGSRARPSSRNPI